MSLSSSGPLILVVIDGLGLRDSCCGNAVSRAETPTLSRLSREGLATRLSASGEAVGLAPGHMGNSNVGHTHLGAGRIVPQDPVRINRALDDGSFFDNEVFINLFERVRKRDGCLHLMGLVSDGGVHSHIDHLTALLKMADKNGVGKLNVHAFLDGRDVPPQSAMRYLQILHDHLRAYSGFNLATVMGRYWAMDRDNRWDRTDRALAAVLRAVGLQASDGFEAVQQAYCRGGNDEFVQPTVIDGYRGYSSNDGFLFFNFRSDRARQICSALLEPMGSRVNAAPLEPPSDLVTMTRYDAEFSNPVAFETPDLSDTLGQVISEQGLPQLRVAETEKYAHVTYFFNGGREEPFPGEERILVPSPSVDTYDQKPQMSADGVTEKVIDGLKRGNFKFSVVNYANPDMVGHSGDYSAAVSAVQKVDECLERVINTVLQMDGIVLVVGDHGNAEQMLDSEGCPHTAHTTNPVPCWVIGGQFRAGGAQFLREGGGLSDIAVTVLQILQLPVPDIMEGTSLLRKKVNSIKESAGK